MLNRICGSGRKMVIQYYDDDIVKFKYDKDTIITVPKFYFDMEQTNLDTNKLIEVIEKEFYKMFEDNKDYKIHIKEDYKLLTLSFCTKYKHYLDISILLRDFKKFTNQLESICITTNHNCAEIIGFDNELCIDDFQGLPPDEFRVQKYYYLKIELR